MFSPVSRSWESSPLINRRYRLGRKLGSGSFAKVHEAEAYDRPGDIVAVKLERLSRSSYPTLRTESQVYDALAALPPDHTPGIPRMHFYGPHGPYQALVLDLLGPSLASIVDSPNNALSRKSVLMIAIQALKSLEALHRTGFLHRDIKPDNMLVGRSEKDPHRLYLADFGLAGRFKDPWGRHIPPCRDVGTVGTVEFSSLNSMIGSELSRRDDLESLGFTLLYLLRGDLPWTHVKAHGLHALQRKVSDVKHRLKPPELCRGFEWMIHYFHTVRQLRFEERPDYAGLRAYFRGVMRDFGYREDNVFEWMLAASDVTDEFPGSSQDSTEDSSPRDRARKLDRFPRDADRGFTRETERLGRRITEKVHRRRHQEKERDHHERERQRGRPRRHGDKHGDKRRDKSPRKSLATRPRRRTSETGRRKSIAGLTRRQTAKAGELGRRNSPREADLGKRHSPRKGDLGRRNSPREGDIGRRNSPRDK